MTEDQFAAHNRALLSWVLTNSTLARRLVRGAPLSHNWTGGEVLHATGRDGDDLDDLDVQFTFSTEFRSGRVVGKLKATFGDGSAEWEGTIPCGLVEASKVRAQSC